MEKPMNWLVALSDEWAGSSATRMPAELATAGLAEGYAALLSGHPAGAGRLFERAWAAASAAKNAKVGTLAARLGFYAEARTFNWLPNGAGTLADDVVRRWNARDRLQLFHARAEEARSWGSSGTSNASTWIGFAAMSSTSASSLRNARDRDGYRDQLFTTMRGNVDDAIAIASEVSPLAAGAATTNTRPRTMCQTLSRMGGVIGRRTPSLTTPGRALLDADESAGRDGEAVDRQPREIDAGRRPDPAFVGGVPGRGPGAGRVRGRDQPPHPPPVEVVDLDHHVARPCHVESKPSLVPCRVGLGNLQSGRRLDTWVRDRGHRR